MQTEKQTETTILFIGFKHKPIMKKKKKTSTQYLGPTYDEKKL